MLDPWFEIDLTRAAAAYGEESLDDSPSSCVIYLLRREHFREVLQLLIYRYFHLLWINNYNVGTYSFIYSTGV